MPERGSTEQPSDVEYDVIRSFGWALVEVEETLFQRFQSLSASRSLTTRDEFKAILRRMEAKGYVAPIRLHDQQGYKKLIAEINMDHKAEPQVPLDEMRLVKGSIKARPKVRKEIPSKVNRELLEECETIGKEIQTILEDWMLRETGRISKGLVHEHVKNMCDALRESEDNLFEYVHEYLYDILPEIGKVLQAYGPHFLLLSLRLAESGIKRYSF